MRKNRKLFSGLLVLSCAVMLFACGKKQEESEVSKENTSVVSEESKPQSSVQASTEEKEQEPETLKYSVEDVLAILGKGYTDPFHCVLDHVDDEGNYVIHLYESVDNGDEAHSATVDWITVNPATGEAENFLGEKFSIESVLAKENNTKPAAVGTGDAFFYDFLNGKIKARVGEGVSMGYYDFDEEHAGEELSFEELDNLMCYSNEYIEGGMRPAVSYYLLNKGGENILFLKFEGVGIEGPTDTYSCSYFVLAKRDGVAEITYSVDTWSRSDEYFNLAGLITGGGSGGAGDYITDEGFIDKSGEFKEIFHGEQCYKGWIGGLFEYFEEGFFSMDTRNLAWMMDGAGSEDDSIALYVLGDTVYGVFYTDEDNEDAEALKASALKDGLVIAPGEHMAWIMEDYAKSLGLTDEEFNAGPMEWTELIQ